MHKYLNNLVLLALIFFLYGCAPATLNTAENRGKSALEARQIFDMISGNTMEMTAFDFSGQFYFEPDGRMAGYDFAKQRDNGSWDISQDNRLCLKFALWYYGDLKCYSLVPTANNNTYTFFTPNGAAYYTGTLHNGDPAGLAKQIKAQKSSSTYLREEFASGGKTQSIQPTGSAMTESPEPVTPQSSSAQQISNDASGSVRRLARNCPGCNLAGADLKEIELVNANLEGADLSRADLRYSNLRRAKLAGADLSSARLNFANLPGADMRGCNLRNADLSGANLLLADLTGADLTGAKFDNAYIENTKGIEK
jgi:hypothetical protein